MEKGIKGLLCGLLEDASFFRIYTGPWRPNDYFRGNICWLLIALQTIGELKFQNWFLWSLWTFRIWQRPALGNLLKFGVVLAVKIQIQPFLTSVYIASHNTPHNYNRVKYCNKYYMQLRIILALEALYERLPSKCNRNTRKSCALKGPWN